MKNLLLFLFLFSLSLCINAQSVSLELASMTEISSTMDLTRIDNITNKPEVLEHWIVESGSLDYQFLGDIVNLNMPGSAATAQITKTYGHNDGSSSYWLGSNIGAEQSLKITKYGGKVSGFFADNSQEIIYRIIGLEGGKSLIVKEPYYASISECGTENMQDNAAPSEAFSPNNDDNISEYFSPNNVDDSEISTKMSCDSETIRVLFLFTAAATLDGDPFTNASGVIDDLNLAVTNSGLSVNLNFEIADVKLLPFFEETPNKHRKDVNALRNSTTAQNFRDETHADIVMLFTGGGIYDKFAGVAYTVKASNKNAYCLVEITQANNSKFTGAHEISHVIGARHHYWDSCFKGHDPSPVYAHGFIAKGTDGSKKRTLMAGGKCGGLREQPQWSNPDVDLNGVPSGNGSSDNARRIDEQGPIVACYRDDPPSDSPSNPSVLTIDGLQDICSDILPISYSVNTSAAITWITPPQWFVTLSGINNNTLLLNSISTPPPGVETYDFELTAISSSGASASLDVVAEFGCLDQPFNGDAIERESSFIQVSNSEKAIFGKSNSLDIERNLSVYPNPTKGEVVLKNTSAFEFIKVLNVNGKEIKRIPVKGKESLTINISNQPKGLYFISGVNASTSQVVKLIKQ